MLQLVHWVEKSDSLSIGIMPYRMIFKNTTQKEIAAFQSDSTLLYQDGFNISDQSKLFDHHEFKEGEPPLANKRFTSQTTA